MPVATTSGCCEKPDRNSDSQTIPPLTLMFYATHPKSAHDPPDRMEAGKNGSLSSARTSGPVIPLDAYAVLLGIRFH
ncbi:hypothetical protein T11_518 [Trichinella zimbabwensis]|uniref:Uncharacterized protein n=1 Tax=Trichinella zimbabwensis TaxID=268475 RepID=A0A0V1HSC7_9BILA|nr:hypothetical protein T11_518 [Trichinella zimbabwensis]